MTKNEIIKLYMADIELLVTDKYAKDKQIKWLESELETAKPVNVDLADVIKCDYCGDTGRVEPTLQYPDGIKCYKCP